ncbi:MAG: 23S rRNA (pseudouridine(1915)-N(3))-methyltransferase RlmH [Muribaculaceae bacterium]|nr:23S rRNA (pseudouridine(1915)-N(3))-methyltransferase RlmH [Muribaculaceae bacterium]MDE6344001.1 23S rRNA (pseudouridine(1915)-N(3))-methyltransferase RlmH [Muribaculaceae bacterium]MDE6610403.1 23S rRNA (pseudouridine(1915)-N(3))-methyltransferase RlmH [Muribaculaceae bacterium]
MKVVLIAVGNVKSPWAAQGEKTYAQRIGHYIPYETVIVPDVKTSKATTPQMQKEAEGNVILSKLQPADSVVLLDERGKQPTSRQLAEMMQGHMNSGVKRLVFVIGGPYGFSESVYARAGRLLSLSSLTFPHELARLIFTEQLYRAMTILRGEPYHHD